MKQRKRIAAFLLAAAMVLSALPMNALAAAALQDAGGLCEHHPEHNADCGHAGGSEGMPCNHRHTEDCYTFVTECVHEHTGSCYPAEAVPDNIASSSGPDEAEPTECTHECSEESGCIKEMLDCPHENGEHDSECGYTPVKEGAPCKFVCEICNQQDVGVSGQAADGGTKGQCSCEARCTGDAIDVDCPVCGEENAAFTACKGKAPAAGSSEAVTAVQEQIDDLSTTEELQTMSAEEQQEIYTKLQKAYDAYKALTDEQKEQITGAEIFDSLFDVFNRMAKPLRDHEHRVCVDGECADPDHGTEHGEMVWTAWEKTDSLPVSAGNYYLAGEVTLSETWEVPKGESRLCLNGNSIIFENGLEQWDMSGQNIDVTSRSVIRVPENSTLTITDCVDTGVITGGSGTFVEGIDGKGYCGGGLFVEGMLNLYGGSIEGNHCPMYQDSSADEGGGGGIFVNGGTVHMYGGEITENSAYQNGNGVFCWGGAFHMYGGSIAENGREIPDWRLTYMGRTGGVSASNGAEMTMSGGGISANLGYYIGGVRVQGEDSSLTMSGDAQITDHTCKELDFGGIYVLSGAKFSMNGGEISGNTEGAVSVQDAEMVMTAGTISAENAGTYGINLSEGSDLQISGGAVSGNTDTGISAITSTSLNSSLPSPLLKLSGDPDIGGISLEPKNVITISGELRYDMPIMVEKKAGGVFTSGWEQNMSGKEPADFFTSWSEAYLLSLSEGELQLAAGETEHTHDGIRFARDLGTDVDGSYVGYPAITESGNYRLTASLNFGDETNLGNTLFIGDGENEIEVNLCLSKYELSRMESLYSGPVIFINDKATLNLYGCGDGAITGNTSETGGLVDDGIGGGILVNTGGTLNLYGGRITGNAADEAAGGIFAAAGSKINLRGGSHAVAVTGNTAAASESNIYLENGEILTISGLPAEGSKIGVSMGTPGLFAAVENGIVPEDAVKFFASDDPAYSVVSTENGLKLAQQHPVPAVSVDYGNESLTGFETGGSYTVNGSPAALEADGTLKIASEWFGSSIAIVRTGGDMADSVPQIISISARPSAPAGLTAEHAGTGAASDGKITGLDSTKAYQYSADGENWTDVPAGSTEITGLAAGTYYVRLAAVEAVSFAGREAKLTVRNASAEFAVTVQTGGHGSAFAAPVSAAAGERITLTAKPDSGYRFKAWEVIAGGVSIRDNQFVMPAEAVTVKAVFEKIPDEGGTSGGGSPDDGSSGGFSTGALTKGLWVQDQLGWWYQRTDGSYPKNEWALCIWNGKTAWYHFDERGYMQTGWFTDAAGQSYYLHDVSDGRQGYMYTGWHQIDGKWYYFREVQDSIEGALCKNTRTPDGYRVDENGVWKP